jgi:serine/threonine-protein kinase PknK
VKLPTELSLPHGGTVVALSPVGEGSDARVLRGELAGRAVGVKIARTLANTSGARDRLAREAIARAVAGSGAPIDGGTISGCPYLAFEWVEGTPLTKLTPSDALMQTVARDVGAALARLHLLGMRHGDVKSDNIVVEGERASLVDFGLAAPLAEPLIGGTPAILPPEVRNDPDAASRVGAEADVYALGLLLRALGAVPPLFGLATAGRAGDRPSAAALAGWDDDCVPLHAAYLLERLPEIERGAHEGMSPPNGPANAFVAPVMRALAGLFDKRADGVPLPALDPGARLRLLTRIIGGSARGLALSSIEESDLLERLGENRDGAIGARDLAFRVVPALDGARALAALAVAPGDEQALAALAADRNIAAELAPAAVAVLRRSGLIEEALAIAERDGTHSIELAELLRLRKRFDEATALLAKNDAPEARAILARIAFDRGELDRADELAGPHGEVRALIAWARGEFDLGLAALDAASADDPERRARLEHVRGMLHHARGDAGAALASFTRAADLAQAIAALPLEATARASAAAAAHDAGRVGDALDASTRAAALLMRLDRPADAARAHLTRAATLVAVGAVTDAVVVAERARTMSERAGDKRGAAYAWFTQAEAALFNEFNDAPSARACVARATALLEAPSPAERVLIVAYAALAGDTIEPARWDEARRIAETVEPAYARWTFLRAALARDDASALDVVLRASDAEAPPEIVGPVLARAIEVARAVGRGDAARPLAERLARRVARVEEDVPLRYRASFAAMPWVAASRATTERGEDLGLARGQIDLLAGISRGLRDRTSLGDLLRQVVDGLVLWVGVERGLLLLRAPDGSLVPRVGRGLSRDDLSGDQLALSKTLARRALDTLEPVVAVDASGDAAVTASIHALRLRSVLAVPLVARGEALGVVYLDDRIRRGAFGPREVSWVRLLATQAAAAIADARDTIRLKRLARRAERARAQLEDNLARTEGALMIARAELARAGDNKSGDPRGTRHRYDAIVGDGAAMRQMLSLVDRVTDAADARIPVLVCGESGTGKELIARAIHENGPRRKGPFVAENCGAIPEPLLESTLFGHVRGAFTGADRARVGLFEIANGGTLLLDEIGEMSLPMQAKLLRVLQEAEVRPVGGERSMKIDVRVVGATHRDLEAMVRDGRFREDLYYRLAVITIAVPSIRERTEDLPALVEHCVRRYAAGRKMRVTRAALAVLAAAPWPGNVRQLENELRRAMVLCEDVLDVEHLSPELREPRRSNGGGLRDQLDTLERRLVTDALRRAGGNQTHAAKALGVSRFGLQKMMKRLALGAK